MSSYDQGYICIECECLYDQSDGDIEKRMCNNCLSKIKENKMIKFKMIKEVPQEPESEEVYRNPDQIDLFTDNVAPFCAQCQKEALPNSVYCKDHERSTVNG